VALSPASTHGPSSGEYGQRSCAVTAQCCVTHQGSSIRSQRQAIRSRAHRAAMAGRIEFSNVALLACERNTIFSPSSHSRDPCKEASSLQTQAHPNAELLSLSYTVFGRVSVPVYSLRTAVRPRCKVRNFFPLFSCLRCFEFSTFTRERKK